MLFHVYVVLRTALGLVQSTDELALYGCWIVCCYHLISGRPACAGTVHVLFEILAIQSSS